MAFAFDRPIRAFELTVSQVGAERRLLGFNVGPPPRLSGTLIQTADGQVTTERRGAADRVGAPQALGDGHGTLTWTDLDSLPPEITLAVGGAGAGPLFEHFGVSCAP